MSAATLATALPTGSPLAIDSTALAALRRGERAAQQGHGLEMAGATAVIAVRGPILAGDGGELARLGYATGLDALRLAVTTAAQDQQVGSITLMVDSPGGVTQGLFETTAAIRSARQSKPMAAVVTGGAYSAAYAISAAAGDIVLGSQTAGAGSIGVIAMHASFAGALEREGIEVTEVVAGNRKADLSPHQQLSDRGRATLQHLVDRSYELLVADITRSRPALGAEGARATDAGLFEGDEAISARLADAIDLPESVIAQFNQRSKQS